MKKLLLFLALSAATFSCSTNDEPQTRYAVLTFEDADFKGTENYLGNSDWSSLIDVQTYGGPLLYGTMDAAYHFNTEYGWYDKGNTELASEVCSGEYGTNYSAGGQAISNYVETDLTKGTPDTQLSVAVATDGKGGYKGSDNFAMSYGYSESEDYDENPVLPSFYFKDGVARVVDHLYIAPATYTLNFLKNGDENTTITKDDYVVLTAIGYDANGEVVGAASIYLLRNGKCLEDWTKFSLASLGKVMSVKFNITGTPTNQYGFAVPTYFAYDNVAVQL